MTSLTTYIGATALYSGTAAYILRSTQIDEQLFKFTAPFAPKAIGFSFVSAIITETFVELSYPSTVETVGRLVSHWYSLKLDQLRKRVKAFDLSGREKPSTIEKKISALQKEIDSYSVDAMQHSIAKYTRLSRAAQRILIPLGLVYLGKALNLMQISGAFILLTNATMQAGFAATRLFESNLSKKEG